MKKIRLIPPFVTLLAGAITSILLYVFGVNYLFSLVVILFVLIIFYVIGVIAMKILMDMKKKEKTEQEKTPGEEGEVIEKEKE